MAKKAWIERVKRGPKFKVRGYYRCQRCGRSRGLLRLYLKYHNDAPVIRELHRVSSPGLRRYVKAREIPRIKNGLGMAILSTPQGLMTDREARTARVGGEVLAVVW